MGAKFILKPLGINRHIESSLFNPPHQVQACTKNILNMNFFVCKTTNSLPNLQLNKRINLMHNCCNSNFHHKTWNDNRHEMQLPVNWDNFQALFKPIHRPEVFVKLKVLTTGPHILHDSIWFSSRKNKTKQKIQMILRVGGHEILMSLGVKWGEITFHPTMYIEWWHVRCVPIETVDSVLGRVPSSY